MTLKEKLEALARGEKLVDAAYPEDYIFMHEEKIRHASGSIINTWYLYTNDFSVWQPPAINLGPEHVGNRVKLRNGSILIITGYLHSTSNTPIIAADRYYRIDGKHGINCDESGLDVLEVID